jgi:membrane protease YdiL (CAAX protease family)
MLISRFLALSPSQYLALFIRYSAIGLVFCSLVLVSPRALASDPNTTKPTGEQPIESSGEPADRYVYPIFTNTLVKEPPRRRSTVWPALVSFVLPGFDQWWENQWAAAGFYSGSAIVGLQIQANALNEMPKNLNDASNPTGRNDYARTALLGSQMVMAAGSYSAFTSFRSAVKSRQASGDFQFLTVDENTGDLLKAPFEMSLLKRPTTFLPILVALGFAVGDVAGNGNAFSNNSFRGTDVGFATGFSYLAGTNEEALFRGYMMPQLMQWWDSPFWSNFTTSVVFAAAHLSADNQLPLPQLALGGYLGYITQQNHWSLKQSVFVHAWWDVIVFTGAYLYNSRNDVQQASWLYLPVVSMTY